MSNPQKVHNFLKGNHGIWFCDDCIQKKAGVDRHEVNTIAWTLALFPEQFLRQDTTCSQACSNRDKKCTQAV
jgi:hypothetical protein